MSEIKEAIRLLESTGRLGKNRPKPKTISMRQANGVLARAVVSIAQNSWTDWPAGTKNRWTAPTSALPVLP